MGSKATAPPPNGQRGEKILSVNLSILCNFQQLWFSWQKSPPPNWSDYMREFRTRTLTRNERLLASYGNPSSIFCFNHLSFGFLCFFLHFLFPLIFHFALSFTTFVALYFPHFFSLNLIIYHIFPAFINFFLRSFI